MSVFEELNPPYGTIVADPPWHYDEAPTSSWDGAAVTRRKGMPYGTMSADEVVALPVADLAADAAHLYLWTTNRHLPAAFGVVSAWGFRYCHTLVWAKPPRGLVGGGAFTITTEFVLFGRRGVVPPRERTDTTWFEWPRAQHSVKPAAFGDLVEQVSPGPYVELFARQPRFGWDSWGKGFETAVPA